jgi:heme oxygenase
VYIRKVHFRDAAMISQIEQKVVNRLRQVTAAIQQDGTNRVHVIRSTAEREAAVEFAKAAATRPRIVGQALADIARDQSTADALFEVLETQNALSNAALEVSVVPSGVPVLLPLDSGSLNRSRPSRAAQET